MGFFSDLKEDLSQAVSELMPQEQQGKTEIKTETKEKDTGAEKSVDLVSEVSLEEMLKNIDDFRLPENEVSVEAAAQPAGEPSDNVGPAAAVGTVGQEADVLKEQTEDPAAGLWVVEELPEDAAEETEKAQTAAAEEISEDAGLKAAEKQDIELMLSRIAGGNSAAEPQEEAKGEEAGMQEEANREESRRAEMQEEVMQTEEVQIGEAQGGEILKEEDLKEEVQKEEVQKEEIQIEESKGAEEIMEMNERVVLDETSVITTGMVVTGDINTEGSVDVAGTVNGNIDAYGKLNITGYINGDSKAAEIYAENAKINGQIISEGAVKIESSTVIIGNISASSAAIAGAVKGDIDVKGPVILDASAIVMGNIKSKSVQINNGAVIEGMCSQCYADVNPTSFFDDYKPEVQTKFKSK